MEQTSPAMASIPGFTEVAPQSVTMEAPRTRVPPELAVFPQVMTEHFNDVLLEPIYYERIQEIPRPEIEYRERLIEVPQPQLVDRIVEIPQVQEVVHEVPGPVDVKLVTREVPKIEVRQQERIVEVPQIEYQDRYVEVPEVREIVRRIPRVEVHEIPIERIIQVPKKIHQEIEQPIYRPVPHLVQQPVEREYPVQRMQMQTMEVVRQNATPQVAVAPPVVQEVSVAPAKLVQTVQEPMQQAAVVETVTVPPVVVQTVTAPSVAVQTVTAPPVAVQSLTPPPAAVVVQQQPLTPPPATVVPQSAMVVQTLSPRSSVEQAVAAGTTVVLPSAATVPASTQFTPPTPPRSLVPPASTVQTAQVQSLGANVVLPSMATVPVSTVLSSPPTPPRSLAPPVSSVQTAQVAQLPGYVTPPTPPAAFGSRAALVSRSVITGTEVRSSTITGSMLQSMEVRPSAAVGSPLGTTASEPLLRSVAALPVVQAGSSSVVQQQVLPASIVNPFDSVGSAQIMQAVATSSSQVQNPFGSSLPVLPGSSSQVQNPFGSSLPVLAGSSSQVQNPFSSSVPVVAGNPFTSIASVPVPNTVSNPFVSAASVGGAGASMMSSMGGASSYRGAFNSAVLAPGTGYPTYGSSVSLVQAAAPARLDTFSAMDQNHDGVVSQAEFSQAVRSGLLNPVPAS